MIKNIVFDLGNVVLKGNSGIVLDYLDIEKEKKKIVLDRFFNNSINDKLDLGEVSLKQHYDNCNFEFDLDENLKEKIINYYKYRPFNDEIIDLMKSLYSNGYNIYILSDNNKEVYNYLKSLEIFKFVKGWIVSCEYKVMKPNKRIYEILFEKYSLNSSESFFIDDKKVNVEAGKSLGMDGFVLNLKKDGINPLLDELKNKKILN